MNYNISHFTRLLLIFAFTMVPSLLFGQDSNDWIRLKDGSKHDMYGEITISAQYIWYDDSNEKRKKQKQKNVKIMVAKNRIFLNLKINGSMERLQEVYAYSNDYIMTGFWQEHIFVYIYDREYNNIERKIALSEDYPRKINLKRLKNSIEPYFGNCPEILSSMRENIENKKSANEGISNYNCNNALELF